MAGKRLFWQISLPYFLVTLLSLLAALLLASLALRTFYLGRIEEDLEARAHLVERQISGPFLPSDTRLDPLCKELGRISRTRITLILPSGLVVADSEKDPTAMDNHADRPEIREAFSGRIGTRIRYSHTLNKEMVYVAVPMVHHGRIVGVVRTSVPLASAGEALRSVLGRILTGVLLIALAAVAAGLGFSRKIARPMEEMKKGAERFARGEFDSRLPVHDSEELGSMAKAMNKMARQLEERIRALEEQRREQTAILASMAEGVLAVNRREQIISVNEAACRMLGIDGSWVSGRSIQESIRNASLQRLVARTLSGQEEVQGESVFETGEGRFLQAHGAALQDTKGEKIGAVIVLNDITQLRRMEKARREFVANVSHELRTPITAIKGFVETLLDGALRSPEDGERFLKIISRQVDQLNAIIEDLLFLSRIELNEDKSSIPLVEGRVREALESAIEVCSAKAAERDVSVGLACQGGLTARMNPPLLTQAVINLVENAIRFSKPGSSVQVEAGWSEQEVYIRVRDHGCGIAQEHIPRITERFYRVDKARSRKLGGTGLGLAIVKHITQAHGGRLTIESAPGKGSTFSICLPAL